MAPNLLLGASTTCKSKAMAERWTRHQALHQSIAVAVVSVLVAAVVMYLARQPQGASSLKAEVSSLRSQAAESALVLQSHDALAGRFFDAHADQLADDVERSRKRVTNLRLQEARLAAGQRFAQDAATRIAAALRGRSSSADGAQSMHALATELERLEQSLQR